MNVTVINQVLSEELRLLTKVTPQKSTIPVLGYVLFQTTEDGIQLSATNLEVAVRTTCAAKVSVSGVVTLPAKKMLELLDQLPDGPVDIALEEKQVHVTSNNFKSRLQTIPAADFPTLPATEGDVSILPALALKMLIERSSYAIDEKPQKFVIDGAFLSLSDGVAAMVATDGKRLSVATATRSPGTAMAVLVPSQTLNVLSALLDGGGDVEISKSERHLFFGTGKRLLISRMIEGTFPKYNRIIPHDCDKKIVVDRGKCAAALRRVNVVADEHQSVYFSAEPGSLHITTSSAGLGDAGETLLVNYNGPPIKICTNARHVLDFLEKATEQLTTLELKTDSTPMLWTDGSDFLNVILVRRP